MPQTYDDVKRYVVTASRIYHAEHWNYQQARESGPRRSAPLTRQLGIHACQIPCLKKYAATWMLLDALVENAFGVDAVEKANGLQSVPRQHRTQEHSAATFATATRTSQGPTRTFPDRKLAKGKAMRRAVGNQDNGKAMKIRANARANARARTERMA